MNSQERAARVMHEMRDTWQGLLSKRAWGADAVVVTREMYLRMQAAIAAEIEEAEARGRAEVAA
jgi:hypothetical protein